MKYLFVTLTILFLLGCKDSKSNNLITDVNFVDVSLEACIKERAEFEGYTRPEELTEVLCTGGTFGHTHFEDLNHFPNLTSVSFHSITNHEVSFNNLQYVQQLAIISSEPIRLVTAQNSPNLTRLTIESSNKLKEVHLDDLPALKELTIRDSVLEELNLASIESLEMLAIGTFAIDAFLYDLVSPIEHLDLTANHNLKQVTLSHTALNTLWVDGLEKLTNLTVYSSELNQIHLDLANLTTLTLFANKLDSIDLQYLPNITHLQLEDNALSDIDLDANTKLNFVRLSNNPLTPSTIEYLKSIDWIDDLKY